MNRFLREILGYLIAPRTLILWGVTSIAATVAGPFGTFEYFAAPLRAMYWVAVVGMSILAAYLARRLADWLVDPVRMVPNGGLFSLFVAVFLAPFIWVLTINLPEIDRARTPSLAQLFFYVFVIAVFISTVVRVIALAGAGQSPVDAALKSRLAERLGLPQPTRIIRLTVRDHYVDVITTESTETLRMRFADAVAEMDPVAGFWTHRSHWVAKGAIQSVVRENGSKIWLEMVNGDRVPVSRKYRGELESAGVL
jgi:ABC-type multidrug transport system fused ATPase/permease subunit